MRARGIIGGLTVLTLMSLATGLPFAVSGVQATAQSVGSGQQTGSTPGVNGISNPIHNLGSHPGNGRNRKPHRNRDSKRSVS